MRHLFKMQKCTKMNFKEFENLSLNVEHVQMRVVVHFELRDQKDKCAHFFPSGQVFIKKIFSS